MRLYGIFLQVFGKTGKFCKLFMYDVTACHTIFDITTEVRKILFNSNRQKHIDIEL
jgi:hypothetical protein